MKIALVRMKYVPYGGAENYLTLVGKELLRQGHEVHIFSNRWEGDDPETSHVLATGQGSGPFIFHNVPIIKGVSFLRALSFAVISFLLLKKERLDIIISFDRILYQDIYRAGDGCHREWLEQRKRIESPLKTLLTTIDPFHRTILYLERRIYQGGGSKRIVTNSFKGKTDIIKYFQTPEERITVIYNGVDSSRFNQSNRGLYRDEIRRKYGIGDDIVILFVGSGFERKGLGFLLKGVSLLNSKLKAQSSKLKGNLKILVVGKGNYSYYKKMGRKLGIEQDIIFAGPTNMVEKYYASSDIFVLPSIYDPFSNACLEAMASGLPVITTKNNGASEIIENGMDGFVIEDPSDIDEMEYKTRLLMDQDLREAFGKRAREKAERFDIENAVRNLVGICD